MDITLALGGGGARGYAHLGVIKYLESKGFRIRAIAGTSAGGIVAATYAAGYSADELEKKFIDLDQSKLFARSANEGPALLGLSGAEKFFQELLGKRTFADLKIPCAVVAVDLKAGIEIVIDKGLVVDGVMATIAVPGVFPPKAYGESLLVDGAVLNPVPVSVAKSLYPGLPVIAVALDSKDEVPNSVRSLPLPLPVPPQLVERLTKTRVAQAFNIFLQSVDVSSRYMAELRMKSEHPDVIVRPNVQGIGILDKVDIPKIVREGETAAMRVENELQKVVAWPYRMRRRIFKNG
jgi:NTE family protein